MTHLRETIRRNRAGASAALPSVCSSHTDVLRAALLLAETLDRPLAVEATSNQVNQFGVYTGMRPADFLAHVRGLAADVGCDADRIVFGGAHLGPQAWRSESADAAMEKARDLVAGYAAAGFTKIHLDCAEGCAGEDAHPGDAVSAARAAELADIALSAAPDAGAIDFIVGTEVPPPGGARDDEGVRPTEPEAARATIETHRAAFGDAARERILALVVQPGVEFGVWDVDHLPAAANARLRGVLDGYAGLAFEAHSTDYQRPDAFLRLAAMGFAILKVGPALTFAWREAIYALDMLRAFDGSDVAHESVRSEAERAMLADPRHWESHYRGDADGVALTRHFSLSDRIRYYWPQPRLAEAVSALKEDMRRAPLRRAALSQWFAADVLDRADDLAGARDRLDALILAKVQVALLPYFIEEGR